MSRESPHILYCFTVFIMFVAFARCKTSSRCLSITTTAIIVPAVRARTLIVLVNDYKRLRRTPPTLLGIYASKFRALRKLPNGKSPTLAKYNFT